MIVLICGGRNYQEWEKFVYAMESLPAVPTMVIQGGARGADWMAKRWAKKNGVHCAEVQALWQYYAKAAGSRRNAAMLLLQPQYCVAFPGGPGTADMVRQSKAAGIPVWQPYG